MKKDGYSENTIGPIGRRLRSLAQRVDLEQPEQVKELVARADWSNGYKQNIVNAYNHYAKVHGISWKVPQYQRARSIKKVPLESDIDLVISHTLTKNRTAFKLIKECGLRPIEVSRLTLSHFDLNRRTVYPETAKGGAARVLELKNDTLALIKDLVSGKNLDDQIFPSSKTLQKNWNRMRNKLAERYSRPELKQIRLYDLRHFYATMLYHRTKDILHVMQKLGHRNIKNTLIYTHLVNFQDDEWICKAAATVEEAQGLIEAGFRFEVEMDGLKLFRKRK